MESYDVIVIGSGPAGEKAANTAAFLKKRVAVIEKEQYVGGAGINTGTIPSKTLRETALALSGVRARRLHGVDLSLRREAKIEDLMHLEHNVRENERARVDETFKALGVTRYTGTASFADSHTVRIRTEQSGSEVLLHGAAIVIASGSSPSRPPEFSFEDDRIHDANEILSLKELPDRLVVIGAGVIGCEYASTFNAIGCEVHLVDGRTSLFPFLDKEMSACLELSMRESGIKFHLGENVEHCTIPEQGDVMVTLASGKVIDAAGVLVCAGRTSNTDDLNLSAAGITPGKRGVLNVDCHYRTEVPHIYAVGDVIGAPALASTSMEQARMAVCHLYGVDLLSGLPSLLPVGIYTIPEASMVGETEESLKAQGIEYISGVARYESTARGKIVGDTKGLLKILFRKEDMEPLGVHIVGEQATELIHLGLFAMLSGNGFNLLKDACYNYPTFAELYRRAVIDAIMKWKS